jgi:hypothetical protein
MEVVKLEALEMKSDVDFCPRPGMAGELELSLWGDICSLM